MSDPAVERYLQLGLRLDRHVEGTVDAYFGPPELAAAAKAESPVDPRRLAADADELLAELEDGWLCDQVAALRTYAGVLAGEAHSYADEVEGCFGVRPRHTDEEVFAAAHERLAEVLPGSGPVAGRYARWQASTRVPAERVETTLAAAIELAREWTRGFAGLPEGECLELESVRDVAYMAFCAYRGGLRSRIEVNVDLPFSAIELLIVAAHETYPGHHTERCLKDELLVRGRGLLEESIVLVPTPQALVAEGIAKLAPGLLLGGDAGPAFEALVRESGVELDLEQALAVQDALEPCRWAEVNATLMLHDGGAGDAEVRAYLERWGLMTPELSAHMLRFFSDPTSRTYVITYPAGHELCEAYVDGDPGRFRRLLTEQVRVGELRRALEEKE